MHATAQLPEYHVRLLTDQQGLNTPDILDLAKDKNGFLWLLSQSSVQRYDGRQARPFLFNETVKKIFVDSKDRKWVLSSAGVYLFKNEYDGFQKIKIDNDKIIATIGLFNSNDVLYLMLEGGVWQYDERQAQFVRSAQSLFSTGKRLTDARSISGSRIFVATNDSILRIDLKRNERSALPFKSIAYMLAVNDTEVLVSDWNSRSYHISFDRKKQQEILPAQIKYAPKNDFLRFFGAVQLPGNRFFISSNMGIVEYNAATGGFHLPVIYNRGRLLNDNPSVKTFFKDGQENIFMTHADGVAFFNPAHPGLNYVRDYSCDEGSIPDIDVRCFAEDKRGHIWLGTVNGIARLNMQTGEVKNFRPSKTGSNNYPTIRDLLFTGRHLVAGTGSKGVWILNTVTNEFSRPVFSTDSTGTKTSRLLNEDFIWAIIQLQNKDIFIAGGRNCYILNSKTFMARMAPINIGTAVSRSVLQDAEGRIWHGNTSGIICYDKNMQRLFSIKDSFTDKRVAAFCEWKKDNMLVGGKGLYEVVLTNNRISSFKKSGILPPGRFIYCMRQDASGNVWLGTDEGLYRYHPLTGKVELFDAADNVQPQAFNSNGLYLAKNNLIFAGGKTGFNYFDPAAVQKKTSTLNPRVSSFSVGNNDSLFFKQNAPYAIDYFNRSIIINISVPEYLRPFALQYRYLLRDKDTSWIDNGNSSTVRMHNLPSGKYRFIASASYDGRHWFIAPDAVEFKILKPWWQQWWFRTLVTSGIIAAILLITGYRKRQRKNKAYQEAIDYFSNSGNEHSSTDDILWDITRNCISRLGFEDCVIYLLDDDQQVLRQRAAYGAKSPKRNEIINPLAIPVGKGVTGHVALTGKAEMIQDTSKDQRYIVDDVARSSEIAVPIIHNEKIIGVIDSEHRQKNFFHQKHLDTLQTIASICAAKISLAITIEKMQQAIRQVNEVNNKMLETQFMNLRLQMNPHFLFNSLSSIQHLIVSTQTSEAYKYLSIFSNFLRSILQYADKTFITLEDELKMLGMYIKLESIGFDENFSYDIRVADDLDTEDIFIPPLILQPLVENAIWHGLLHKEGKKYFSVDFINNNDEQLLCIVEDNGIGRNHAARIKEKNLHTSAYKSKATALIKERLFLLRQQTGKDASINTEDLVTDNQTVTGTRVTIIIPYYNNNEAQ
ncbi:MAG: histidine kinase [Rhizobacter sp.]|nr:histidine kinase [Ferruginibacter sp.]